MEKTKIKRGKIADRFRAMKVGETIFFPIDKYNPNSVRATPHTTLHKELTEGKRWTTKFDPFGKRVAVTRLL